MSFSIASLGSTPPIQPIGPSAETQKPREFRSVLETAIDRVELSQAAAARAGESFLTGEGEELHTAIIATQEAELELETFLQVRNKVVQAYQEIMRMQV